MESIRTPRLATSRQAVVRFFRLLGEISRPTAPAIRNDAARGRANHEVEQEFDRLGI